MDFLPQNVLNYLNKERQIIYDRSKRKDTALQEYIALKFETPPKMSLEQLQSVKSIMEKQFLENPNNEKIINLLIQINTKITNEDYLKPDTDDITYLNNYNAYVNQFAWPTDEELLLQNQENAELENLKNSF